jgi:PAS domain S-box-containing protein
MRAIEDCPPTGTGDDRFRALVEQLPAIVMEMQPDGAISYANTNASVFFNLSWSCFGQEKPEAHFCVRHLEAIYDSLGKIRPDAPETSLTTRVDLGGSRRWIEWSLRGTPDGDGAFRSYLVVGFDITEKKGREKRLEESRELAEAAFNAKSEFMTNMSHELRTPLNGVMGMLQLLRGSDLDPEQADFANTAMESCDRLARLISDILDLSRVEARKTALSPESFSLRQLVQDVRTLFEPTAKQAKLSFSCRIDESIPDYLLGDRLHLQQVLNNLVGNALKFTKEGGIQLRACRQLPAGQEPFRVLLTVSDTGIGVPEEKIDSIFSPFTQVSTGYSRQFEGAGLGLALSRRLVELMGGNMSMETEVGLGTTVAVSLPMMPAGAEDLAELVRRNQPACSAAGLSILLAEDDYVMSYAVRVMLERSGFLVQVAANGREAIRLLGEKPFDVVLMDLQMPEMGGVEAVEAIRRGEAGRECASIPIVVMTAYTVPDDRERLSRSGVSGSISKPVSKKVLLEAVMNALAHGSGCVDLHPAVDGEGGEPGDEPMPTRFAPARRSSPEAIERDFRIISQDDCTKYLNFFPLPLLVLNADRQIVFSNQVCLGMLDVSDEKALLGRRPGEVLQCAYSTLEPGGCGTSRFCRECGIVKAVLRSMEINTPTTFESRVLQSVEGECRAMDLSIHATPFDVDRVLHVAVTIQDISDLKRREMMERVFFHDIMNTAGGARNLVELLLGDDDDDVRESLELLSLSLNGLVGEIASQRDLVLAENGDYPISKTAILSRSVVEDVARELRRHPVSAEREIAVSRDSCDRVLKTDLSLLHRVLVNMVKNGLEATPPGGTVRIGCSSANKYVVFEVRNDQAMDQATQCQIFKRFYSTKGRGRGVGTYSIKLLTENYLGGRADFTSNAQVGTIFRVFIPESG